MRRFLNVIKAIGDSIARSSSSDGSDTYVVRLADKDTKHYFGMAQDTT